MDSAGLRWYRTGTVTVTQGSTVVIGVGTNWKTAGIKPGDIFRMGDIYEIAEVADNTTLTLAAAFQGANGAAQNYAIIRNFAGTLTAELAAQTALLVNKYETYIDTDLKQIVGPPGPAALMYRGEWAAGREYRALDVAVYGGKLYIARSPHTSASTNAPGMAASVWDDMKIGVDTIVVTSHALTAAEAAAKSFKLPSTPEGTVFVSVLGLVHRPGIDYAVSGNTLRWNGLGLEQNALAAGDVFVLIYKAKGV